MLKVHEPQACEYIPAVVQLTQGNIFHTYTHLPLSLEKPSDFSFSYKRRGAVKEENQE